MATAAISATGTLLKIGDGGGSEVFTTIAEVTAISGPKLTQKHDDATSHTSTGGYEESIVVLLHGGEITLSINYVPTAGTHNGTTGLVAEFKNKTLRNYQLVFPNGSSTTWTLPAFCQHFEPKAPVGGKLAADITLKISGQPTIS